MLEPNIRALFLDSLRPPVGCSLDRAVGTTFTVDLTTALTVPLALAGYNLAGTPDPIAVMQALRSTTNRVDVFAQAGMISSSAWPGDLTALIEPMLHTVRRPRPGHLFHPKVWLLRFVDGEGVPNYRCIVSSRNLTPDRSWDVLLRLDSDPGFKRVNVDNQGLVSLIDSLPSMPQAALSDGRADEIRELAAEIRRVTWQHPDGVDSVRFLAFGVPGGLTKRQRTETFRGYRHLLISPFLTSDGIDELRGDSSTTNLSIVSRAEAMNALEPGTLDHIDCYTLNPLAELDDSDTPDRERLLGGLHAKVYAIEAAKRAYVFVGSANATNAAFNGNVEILCELSGGPKALGVKALLAAGSPFMSLLESFSPSMNSDTDESDDRVRHALESVLVDIAGVEFSLEAEASGEAWATRLRSPTLPDGPAALKITLSIAPFNLPTEAVPLELGVPSDARFTPRASADLTPFLILAASTSSGGKRASCSTVIKAKWINEPPNRLDDIMIRQLDTPEKFLRFIMLLLALGGDTPTGLDVSIGGGGSWQRSTSTTGLFELLVRALAVQPEAIDRLGGIVEHLRKSPLAKEVLPPEWDEVWAAISAARDLIGVKP